MLFKDNFDNPQGFVGKMMLFGMNKGHTPMAKWAFTQFDVPKDGKLLDVGCGGGYNVKRLLEKSEDAIVYGADISETCVEKSEAVNKKYLGTRCEIYKAGAIALPFDDNTIKLVTAFETVYFWKEIENCFKEIYRILEDGGKFVIVNDPGDPNKHWDEMIPDMKNWKVDELEQIMEDTGFIDIKTTKSKFKVCVIGIKPIVSD